MASTYELIIKAVDQTRSPLRRVEQSLDSIEKRAKQVSVSVSGIGKALAAFAAGATVRSIVTTTARFEDLSDTLKTVTGSARAGSDAFKFIQNFATRTQFGVEELTTTFIKLQGAGIKPTEQLLTTFTDTAAVTTDQLGTLEAMTDLFSRTISGGLGLEELNRLADRGVPVFKILEDQLGLTRLEISKFGQSAEGAARIREALQRGLNESFGGATQDKVDNLSTAMSNFVIAVQGAEAKIGEGLRPQLTAAITDATKFIETNDKLLQSLGTNLGTAIEATANSLKFLADNFGLIKDAAIGLISLQAFRQVTFIMSDLRKNFLAVGATSKGVTSALGSIAAGAGRFLGNIKGISAAMRVLAPLLLNPWTAIPKAIALAIAAGLALFKDELIKVQGVTGTLGEYMTAAWQMIGDGAGVLATYLKENLFGGFFDRIESYAKETTKFFAWMFNIIGGLTKKGVNFIANAFVALDETIVKVATNIPEFFRVAFDSLVTLASDAVSAVGKKFTNMWEAIKLGATGNFSEAWAKLGEDSGYSFSQSFAEAFKDLPSLTEGIDYAEIFDTDRVGAAMDYLDEKAFALGVTITSYATPALTSLADRVKFNQQVAAEAAMSLNVFGDEVDGVTHSLIQNTNSANNNGAAVTANNDKIATATTYYHDLMKTVNEAAQNQDFMGEAVRRLITDFGAGLISAQQYAAGMRELSSATASATLTMAERQAVLQSNVASTIAEANANKALYEAYNDGTRSAAELAAARRELGIAEATSTGSKAAQLTASQQLIKSMQDEKAQLADLQAALKNVSALAKAAGVSEATLTKRLQDQIATLRANNGEVKSLTQTIQEYWKQTSESFASTLANDIVEGKNVLTSFKDFFKRTLKDIARMIIEQQITKPLMMEISQLFGMMNGMPSTGMFGGGMMGGGGLLGGLFGGGGGGFLSGIFGQGGFFSNIFTGIGGFFSNLFGGFFANGGIPPMGQASVVGERGPELFVPGRLGRVIPNDELNTGGQQTVVFEIRAIDSKSGTEFILENKDQIVGVINDAYQRRGKVGIY